MVTSHKNELEKKKSLTEAKAILGFVLTFDFFFKVLKFFVVKH